MKPSAQPVLRDLVLVGGGHSHVGVLRIFAMKPEPGVRITLICTDIDTPYSGMLPGYIAGHYSFDEVHIDLGRLCAFVGARLYHAAVVGIDRQNQKVICQNRPSVAYEIVPIQVQAPHPPPPPEPSPPRGPLRRGAGPRGRTRLGRRSWTRTCSVSWCRARRRLGARA